MIIIILSCSVVMMCLVIIKNATRVKEDPEQEREMQIVTRAVDLIRRDGVNLNRRTLEQVVSAIYRVSRKNGIDYRIVLALAKVESNFRNEAVSPKGARGLLQIKPSVAEKVAKDLGIDLRNRRALHECEKNVEIGTYILSNLIEKYYDIHAALSGYNMGQDKLLELSGNDRSTTFSRAVLREYKKYIEILPDP